MVECVVKIFSMFFIVVIGFVSNVSIANPQVVTVVVTQQANGDDPVTKVICNVIKFVQGIGLPIMTGVILGSSIMAIFGKLPWPAIVMLVVFTAIFFGAGKLMHKFASGVNSVSSGSQQDVCNGGGGAAAVSSNSLILVF
ncbi:TrbC/VirB2 family protein [Ehrlichia ruminantium]